MYTALISENMGLATGTALAHKLDGKGRVVVIFEGDSAGLPPCGRCADGPA